MNQDIEESFMELWPLLTRKQQEELIWAASVLATVWPVRSEPEAPPA